MRAEDDDDAQQAVQREAGHQAEDRAAERDAPQRVVVCAAAGRRRDALGIAVGLEVARCGARSVVDRPHELAEAPGDGALRPVGDAREPVLVDGERELCAREREAAVLVDEHVQPGGAGAADDRARDRARVAARLVDRQLRQDGDPHGRARGLDLPLEAARLARADEPGEVGVNPDAGYAQGSAGIVEALGARAAGAGGAREQDGREQRGDGGGAAASHRPASTRAASSSSIAPKPVRAQTLSRS